MPFLLARLAALCVLLATAGAALAADTPAVPDCDAARALPAGANAETRRIVCEIPDKYRRDVAMAETIGLDIRRHDAAAWRTTDLLVANHAFDHLRGEGRGWLTLEDATGIDVRFFDERDGVVGAIAQARFDAASLTAQQPRVLAPPEPMTAREAPLMRAKLAALATDPPLCTKHSPNTVVTEFEEDGVPEILVFVMSAWMDKHEAPLGGYHMFRYSADGQTLLSRFSQTRSCVVSDLDPALPGGAKTSSLMVSHLASATPTMFHVFMSLQFGQPLYVVTTQNGLLWRVEDGSIHLEQGGRPVAGAADADDPAPNPDHAESRPTADD